MTVFDQCFPRVQVTSQPIRLAGLGEDKPFTDSTTLKLLIAMLLIGVGYTLGENNCPRKQ